MSNSFLEKIMVPFDFNEEGLTAIKHAVVIAQQSNKEINLVHIVPKKNPVYPLIKARSIMQDMINQLNKSYSIRFHGFVLEGDPHKMMTSIAEKTESAMVIVGVAAEQKISVKMLRMIYPSRVPFLFVREYPDVDIYNHIYFPLDPTVQTKEKVFWGVFFSKFFGSTIHILLSKPKEKQIDRVLQNNMIFTKGIFQDFNVRYSTDLLEGQSFDIHSLSLQKANSSAAGIMIMMTTKHFGLFDYILGPHEQKILNAGQKMPILCVNSREDLYVPCI